MDPGKRQALINWWNAVSEKKIKSFEDLRDGSIIAAVLLTCGDNLIPSDTDLTSPQRCLEAIKFYMESFYQQSLDDCTLINFKLLTNHAVTGEILELEIGKLLLALLGCVIQDRGRENFITPALSMDEKSQSEMKLIIMSTIYSDDAETKLHPGFHEILRQKQEPMSHVDAALFFKLVAEGGPPTANTPGPKTPVTSHGGSTPATMYTNSPQANRSDINIRDISSPLRLMALSSPVTPLGALMSSPQFTQKAALRQKDYEYRHLQSALRNEQHLRSEVEMDLMEKSKIVEEKDKRIRELERQLANGRQRQDMVDELMELRTANETMHKDISRLQTRLQETQDMREHNTVLQKENSEYLADLQKARDQLKMLESIQSASETYRAKCHKQQVEISDLELALQHRKDECATLQKSLDDFVNMHEIASENVKILRAEKEELEELLGTRNTNMASNPLGFSLGESMSVVTEKKLAELQVQYETIRTSWIDPLQHTNIVKELQLEKETKKTYEERYMETRKKLLECEDEIQKLHNSLQQSNAAGSELEGKLQEVEEARENLRLEVSNLHSSYEVLRQSEAELRAIREQMEGTVETLRKDLSHSQTELELSKKELEMLNEANETRRQTIVQLDQEKLQKTQAEQKLTRELEKISKELEVWKSKGEKLTASEEVVVKLQMEKVDTEKRFTEKIQLQSEEIDKMKDVIKSEQSAYEEKISGLNEKLQCERNESEKRHQYIQKLQDDMDNLKTVVDEKERLLEDKLENTLIEKRTVDLEVHRLTLELSSTKDSYDSKIEKMEVSYKDEVNILKKEINNLKTAKEECVIGQEQLKKEMGKLNQTIQKQKEELKRLNSVIESLKSGNTDLVDSLEKSKLSVVQYQHELKTLKEKINIEEKHSASLKKEKSDMFNSMQSQMEATVKQFHTEKLQLSEQIHKMQIEMEEKRRDFHEMKCSMEGKFTKAKCDYEKNIDNVKNEHKNEVETFQEQIKVLTSSNKETVESLESTISELEEKLKNSETVHLELQAVMQEKESMLKSLSEQLEYKEGVEQHLKSTVVMLEADQDTMKNLIEERDKVKSELTKLNNAHEEHITSLKQTLQMSEQETVQQQEKALEEIDCLKTSLSEKSGAYNDLQEEYSKLVQKTDELAAEMKTVQETFETQLENKSIKCDNLEQENNNLSLQVEELQRSNSELSSQMYNSNASAESIKHELEIKLAKEKELHAQFESQFTVLSDELKTCKDSLETLSAEKTSTEESLKKLESESAAEVNDLKQRLVETEDYLKSQLADLQMEYENGITEQKEEMDQQMAELRRGFEAQLEELNDEKEMCISSQSQSYQDRIVGLEKVVAEKKEDLEKQAQDMATIETNYKKTIENMKNELMNQSEIEKGTQVELEGLKCKVEEITEEKRKEVEMLIGQYETQLDSLRTQLCADFEESKTQLEQESKSQITMLQSEVNKQRENYQQMMCEMQEKLGGETVTLKERLSQMKCQYESLIENKEKDTKEKVGEFERQVSDYKTKVSDYETKLTAFEAEKASLEGQLDHRNTEITQLQTELSNRSSTFENEISELKESNEKLKTELMNAYKMIEDINEELNRLRIDSQQAMENQNRGKGEIEELRRQLEYSQTRNDTLTAELSSQQQQLAAVEEEKRTVEEERQSLEQEANSLATSHSLEVDTLTKQCDQRGLEIEELERQLQASQKCYEVVQKTQTELESQAVRFTEDRNNLEQRNRELEQRVYGYMEREKRMMEENQHHIDKAAELNGTLRRQLDEKCQELMKVNEQFNNKMQSMTHEVAQMKQKYDRDLQALVEEKTALEIEAAQLKQVQDKLKVSEAEAKRLQDVNTQYNIHYNKKKEIISSLDEKLKNAEKKIATMVQTEDKLLKEVAPLREKLEFEKRKNGNLVSRINTLEAQNNLADRKLREYRQELEKGTAVFMGDSSEFQKMLRERESEENASFMENHPSSIPLNNSVFKYEKHEVERHQAFYDDTRSMSETLTPNRRSSRSKKKMSKSVSSSTVLGTDKDKDADTVSIGSASSLAYRLRSRESAVSLNRSFSSLNSCKSNASVPRGTGGIFHCEDEPMEFEWGRLGELQRRNTLCPAHMKTSYPVETQIYKPTKFREDALRESTMGTEGNKPIQELTGSGRKRKQAWDSDSAGSDSADGRKLAKTGCVYQKPGPPTPANQRRNSGKGSSSRSPGSRNSKGSRSPRTPYGLRKRTPKCTPKKRSSVVDNRENTGSAKKAGWRDSVAFSIGFSPKSTGNHKALRRQQGFIQKQPQSSSQIQPHIRKPLGTRNILQTGV